jgi:ATP-dependent DNA helicase RecG
MSGELPMSRLLQGDVGSGKTAVAATVIFCTSKNGYQSALMAPTEFLPNSIIKTLTSILNGAG